MKLHELDARIRAVCPIDGINSEGVIWFKPEADAGQRAAAQALMDELGHLIAHDPTPEEIVLEQIRSIERTPKVSDAMQRGSRLVALSYAIDEVIRVAAAKGQTVTRQQAHDWSMVNDSNYKTLYDAEQAIKPLRPLV